MILAVICLDSSITSIQSLLTYLLTCSFTYEWLRALSAYKSTLKQIFRVTISRIMSSVHAVIPLTRITFWWITRYYITM